jgi:hypothetical protein
MANNSTQIPVTNQLLSFYETAKPQYSNVVFYNHKYILPMNVFKSLGLTMEIQGETSYGFEAGWLHPNFHAQATVAPVAAGANLTFQVATNDVTNSASVYVRVTDTVLFKDGTAGEVITVTDAGSGVFNVVVQPYATTFTLGVTAGDAIWITGNSQAEGTGSPRPRTTGYTKVQYPLQILKEAVNMTGSALTDQLWYEKDQFGGMRDTYTSNYLDAEFRFLEQIGDTAVFGPVNTNPAITKPNMYSMDYVVSTSGKTLPYTAGNYGINEFKENIRYSRKKASGSKFLVLAAPELSLAMTTGLSDVFAQNPNIFGGASVTNSPLNSQFIAGYESEATSKGVEINMKRINYDGIIFDITNVQQWGIEVGGGADGFKQTGYGFFIPLTKAQNEAGKLEDRFTMTYKKKDRWNRAMQIWETGGQATTPTSDVDELQINFLAHWGTKFNGAEHFQRVKPI